MWNRSLIKMKLEVRLLIYSDVFNPPHSHVCDPSHLHLLVRARKQAFSKVPHDEYTDTDEVIVGTGAED